MSMIFLATGTCTLGVTKRDKGGNAVCPSLAEAMVRANFPEWCTVTIVNMAQFHKAVAM